MCSWLALELRGLHAGFSAKGKGGKLSGAFEKDVLIGVLEGKDFQCIASVDPFLGACFERACGEEQDAVSRTLSLCAEVMQMACCHGRDPVWANALVEQLRSKIGELKAQGASTLAA